LTAPQQKGRIFISYRRADTAGYAGRIYDRLSAHFGEDAIFMDVDKIPAGLDFSEVLESEVQACDVLVALMGRQWLNIKDPTGKRRLDNPQDFVRIEIAAALRRGIRVIPVLFDRVEMPRSTDLPHGLKRLARRNAVFVQHHAFHANANHLIKQLELALKAAEESKVLKAKEFKEREEQKRKKVKIANLLSQADIAIQLQGWELAKEKLAELLALEPKQAQGQVKLEIVEHKLREINEQDAVEEKAKEEAEREAVEKAEREKFEKDAKEKAEREATEKQQRPHKSIPKKVPLSGAEAQKHADRLTAQRVKEKSTRQKNTLHIKWTSLFWITASWVVGGIIGEVFSFSFSWLEGVWLNPEICATIGFAISGTVGGWGTAITIQHKNFIYKKKELFWLVISWTISGAIVGSIVSGSPGGLIDMLLLPSTEGLIGGGTTALILRKKGILTTKKETLLITLGWTISLGIGLLAGIIIEQETNMAALFRDNTIRIIVSAANSGAISGFFHGAIGGFVMLYIIKKHP